MARRNNNKGYVYRYPEKVPSQYCREILAGKIIIEDVPEKFKGMTLKFLEIASHAEERQAVSMGAKIAMIPSLEGRRRALLATPEHLRARVKYWAEKIYLQEKTRRQQCLKT